MLLFAVAAEAPPLSAPVVAAWPPGWVKCGLRDGAGPANHRRQRTSEKPKHAPKSKEADLKYLKHEAKSDRSPGVRPKSTTTQELGESPPLTLCSRVAFALGKRWKYQSWYGDWMLRSVDIALRNGRLSTSSWSWNCAGWVQGSCAEICNSNVMCARVHCTGGGWPD